MEGSLREMIGNWLILNTPPPPPPPISDLIHFLMAPILSIFQKPIKVEYQVLAIFQSFFFLVYGFYF